MTSFLHPGTHRGQVTRRTLAMTRGMARNADEEVWPRIQEVITKGYFNRIHDQVKSFRFIWSSWPWAGIKYEGSQNDTTWSNMLKIKMRESPSRHLIANIACNNAISTMLNNQTVRGQHPSWASRVSLEHKGFLFSHETFCNALRSNIYQ